LVHKKGVVSAYFKKAEEGFVATPMHGIYEPSGLVNAAITKKYGWTDPPFSFLLYFLFISRENLLKTSINFNGVRWKKGEDIPLVGMTNIPEGIAGDTGFPLGLELFEKGVPFYKIPRSETAGLAFEKKELISLLIEWMKDKKNFFSHGWLHLQNTGNTIPLWFSQDLEARIWHLNIEEPRLAWMYEMMRTGNYDSIPEFKKRMEDIFRVVALKCGANIDRIKTIADIFHILLYE